MSDYFVKKGILYNTTNAVHPFKECGVYYTQCIYNRLLPVRISQRTTLP